MIHVPDTGGRPTLVITRTLPAPPEKVWRAWTEPERLAAWFGPYGMQAQILEFSLRVGGTYRITFPSPAGIDEPDAVTGEDGKKSFTLFGEYRAIEPPKRLVYTWAWDSPGWAGKTSVVELGFEPQETDEGPGTLLTVTHSDLLDDRAKKEHGEGWGMGLERLKAYVSQM